MNKLRQLRKQRGLRLVAVAAAVQTHPGNLSRIERGKQLPSLPLALRLSAFYGGVTVEDFYR